MVTRPPPSVALVTGASSGLGEAFARLLARYHWDLVLTARSEDKLRALAEGLEREHGGKAHVIPADLARPDAARALMDEVRARGLALTALVNNAGYGVYGPFTETDGADERDMIQINVVALTELTKLVLPTLLERPHGYILNVASTAAFQPGPLMATYYATKAYVLSFSEALAEETRGSGVTVTTFCPGPVRTGFQARAKMEKSKLVAGKEIMGAEEAVRVAYDAMMKGKRVVIPGLKNKVLAGSVRFAPRAWVTRSVRAFQETRKDD